MLDFLAFVTYGVTGGAVDFLSKEVKKEDCTFIGKGRAIYSGKHLICLKDQHVSYYTDEDGEIYRECDDLGFVKCSEAEAREVLS